VLWPDYGAEGLADVVEQYRNRDRRFGGRAASVEAAAPVLAAG
jgi:undecaprenyl diphosphate synthase